MIDNLICFLAGVLFTIILLQMMIPTAALLVPNFSTIRVLGLYDSIPGIALPFFGSAFATFLLRQSFLSLPRDLGDAAAIANPSVSQSRVSTGSTTASTQSLEAA